MMMGMRAVVGPRRARCSSFKLWHISCITYHTRITSDNALRLKKTCCSTKETRFFVLEDRNQRIQKIRGSIVGYLNFSGFEN